MSPAPATPTKLIRFMGVVIGIAMVAPTLKHHWGKPGLFVGIFLGALLGWLIGWWVKRTFLEF